MVEHKIRMSSELGKFFQRLPRPKKKKKGLSVSYDQPR